MRVKKLLALALAGALSASMLAGCNRTLIEHQFFMDTMVNTEYKTVVGGFNTLKAELSFQRLDNLLKQYGGGSPVIEYFYNTGSEESVNHEETSLSDLENQLNLVDTNGQAQFIIVKKCENGKSMDSLMLTSADCIAMLCDALENTNMLEEVIETNDQAMLTVNAFFDADDESMVVVHGWVGRARD